MHATDLIATLRREQYREDECTDGYRRGWNDRSRSLLAVLEQKSGATHEPVVPAQMPRHWLAAYESGLLLQPEGK